MSSEEYLLSGFGPFGRNRLFYEQTGRSIVSASKDITQLLGSDAYDMFSFGKQSNELNIFLQNSCKEYTQRVGDGLKNTLLLLHSFLEGLRFDRNSNCSYSNQHALSLGHIPAQIQVQILDIIYSVIKSHRHLIESDFRRQKVWFLANDARDWFSSIVKSVLIPAMTASSTQASRLERILVSIADREPN